MNFSCSADHEQDWQSHPVDSYSDICDYDTYIASPFPRLPTKGMIGYVGAAWGGLSGGCKAGLTLKEEDSFLLPPRPWPWCGGGVGSARCSLGTHPLCESSTSQRFKRRHVRRFGACAEADDTVVESWCVLIAPGV